MTAPTPILSSPRIIPSAIGPVIPVVDIVRNLGYNRSTVSKAMSRHADDFEGLTVSIPLDTTGGEQHFKCLNQEAVKNLILLLSPSEKDHPDLKERVRAFKENEFRKMGVTAPLAIAPAPALAPEQDQDTLTESLRRNAERAKILIEGYGYQPEVARKLAMEKVMEETQDAALIFRGPAATVPQLPAPAQPAPTMTGLPESDPDFETTFSMQKICEMCHCTRDEAVNLLDKEGIIHYANGIWHLTRLGERYGKAFTTYPLFPHRMTEKRLIRYWPVAVNLIRGRLATTPVHDAAISRAAADAVTLAERERNFEMMRNVINTDTSGLAAALATIREKARGYRWIPDKEWGSYDYTERTVETLQKECGFLLDEIEKLSYEGLRDSGNRVIARIHSVEEELRRHAPQQEERR